MSVVHEAIAIAARDLRSNYRTHGIVAGATHFADYWLRDMAFASLGALALGDTDVVRRGIEFFLATERGDGVIAFRAGTNSLLKYLLAHLLGRAEPGSVPRYLHDKILVNSARVSDEHAIDSFPMLFLAIAEYIKVTGDTVTIQPYLPALDRLMSHYQSKHMTADTGLIGETGYSGWADSVRKEGTSLLTNVLYVAALEKFCFVTSQCHRDELTARYLKMAGTTKQSLIDRFWNGRYLVDWVKDDRVYDYFSVDGNLLAIVLGILPRKQATMISEYFLSVPTLYEPVPCKTNYPKYPNELQYWALSALDYHNYSTGWLWLGSVSAIALTRLGKRVEAARLCESMARTITEYGTVYETYDQQGKPFRKLFYTSERAFSWSAGAFLWMAKEMGFKLPR